MHWIYPDIWNIKVVKIKIDYIINKTSLNRVSDTYKCVIIRNNKQFKIEKKYSEIHGAKLCNRQHSSHPRNYLIIPGPT